MAAQRATAEQRETIMHLLATKRMCDVRRHEIAQALDSRKLMKWRAQRFIDELEARPDFRVENEIQDFLDECEEELMQLPFGD